jgi:hypothetical protein
VNRVAWTAGVLYLVVAAAAIVAHFYVPDTLFVADDAAATTANIAASPSTLHLGIGSELVILLSEVVISILLYFLFRPVSAVLAVISSAARLVMTTIHGFNLLNYSFLLMIAQGLGGASGFQPAQQYGLVSLFLEGHSYGFTIGVVFLSLHAVLLGYLIYKSGYIPRVLGVLFLIASAGYLIDSTLVLFLSSYETTPVFIAMPIAVAELAFPVWLLIKGVNKRRWEERVGAGIDPRGAPKVA